MMNQNVSESPNRDVAPSLGRTRAPLRRLEHAQDEEGESCGPDHDADHVEVRALLHRGVGGAACQHEDGEHDQHFAGEDVAPGEVGGHEAADHRAHGDRDRAGGGDESVGPRPSVRREVAGHQRDDGRHDQHGAEALEEGPADDEHRKVGRQRGRHRPATVDDAAQGEGPLRPIMLPTLPPRTMRLAMTSV